MGDMVVLRDPNGFRPLCYAQDGPLFAAASESVPLLNLGFQRRPVAGAGRDDRHPGRRDPPRSASPREQTPSHCFFEWIYFANVASTLDDRSVYLTRAALGKELARQERQLGKVPLDDDTIVVPVPDTGKAAADAMAFELGLPSRRGADPQPLHRPDLHRGPEPGRARAAEVHAAARGAGRQARAADRGHHRPQHDHEGAAAPTCASAAGRREIHVRVACPPIVAPCFYGIDMSTVRELFAPRFMKGSRITEAEQDAMAAELGADSCSICRWRPSPAASAWTPDQLCRGCLTGKYPTPTGERLYQLSLRNRNAPSTAAPTSWPPRRRILDFQPGTRWMRLRRL